MIAVFSLDITSTTISLLCSHCSPDLFSADTYAQRILYLSRVSSDSTKQIAVSAITTIELSHRLIECLNRQNLFRNLKCVVITRDSRLNVFGIVGLIVVSVGPKRRIAGHSFVPKIVSLVTTDAVLIEMTSDPVVRDQHHRARDQELSDQDYERIDAAVVVGPALNALVVEHQVFDAELDHLLVDADRRRQHQRDHPNDQGAVSVLHEAGRPPLIPEHTSLICNEPNTYKSVTDLGRLNSRIEEKQ